MRASPLVAGVSVAAVAASILAAVAALAVFAVVAERRRLAASRRAVAARERSARDLVERLAVTEAERGAMRLVLSSMDEGILLFGPTGVLVYANPAAERHLGSAPATLAALLPLGLKEAVELATTERRSTVAEVEIGSPIRRLRGSVTPVDAEGTTLLIVRDVTEARRLESVRRDFVANASHELKTPAASIQAAAETIVNVASDDPAVVPKFAAQLEREAVRLSRIVSDLLDLSRLESGTQLDEDVSLATVVRDEVERYESAAAEAGIALSVAAEDASIVRGTRRDLSLLVRNLIDNAVRYTPPGGRVDVTVRTAGGEALLVVRDTGIGIPTRDLPRIFERFYRVDRARSRETGGTGLGLSIVRHVASNHGGSVRVESELGRGTVFEVRLPAAAAAGRRAAADPSGVGDGAPDILPR